MPNAKNVEKYNNSQKNDALLPVFLLISMSANEPIAAEKTCHTNKCSSQPTGSQSCSWITPCLARTTLLCQELADYGVLGASKH